MRIPTVTSHSLGHHDSDGSEGSPVPSGWASIIGIVTAIVGNVLISFALNTQRYAHVRLEQECNEKKGVSLSKRSSNGAPSYGATNQDQSRDQRTHDGEAREARGNLSPDPEEDEDPSRHLQNSFRSDDTIRAGEKDSDSGDGRKSYLKSPIWWTGIVLMTVGETGNFLAYGFAPASIVSPLGVVALISNCLIAPFVLKEKFRRRDFWGVIVAIAGAVTVVLSAKQEETKLEPDQLWDLYVKRWEFLLYVILTVLAIVALMFASPRYGKRSILIDIGLVGLFGGYTALSTKGVASLLSTQLWKAFAFPIFYVLVFILIASAVMQIRYLNNALQNFDSTQVIPTQFVLFTLSVIIGSAVLYRDFESTSADRAIKFVAGCLLTFFGVYLITSKREPPDGEKEDYVDQNETAGLLDDETEQIDERTPLTLDTARGTTAKDSDPQTPPRSPTLSADVPSIAVTPASGSPLGANPWEASLEQALASKPHPQTPVIRSQSDLTGTPFYTPGTSRPLRRNNSSHADPETPTRLSRTASPPKPDRSAIIAAEADTGLTLRSARNSISRLFPGPLLPPLSSSLSGIVADSLRRGEGSPLSVRQRLRRNHLRSGAAGRRRSIAPGDEESGFARSDEGLDRSVTHTGLPPGLSGGGADTTSAPDVRDVVEGAGSTDQKKSRLRSVSETLGSMIGGGSSLGSKGGGRGTKTVDPLSLRYRMLFHLGHAG